MALKRWCLLLRAEHKHTPQINNSHIFILIYSYHLRRQKELDGKCGEEESLAAKELINSTESHGYGEMTRAL